MVEYVNEVQHDQIFLTLDRSLLIVIEFNPSLKQLSHVLKRIAPKPVYKDFLLWKGISICLQNVSSAKFLVAAINF